MVVFSMVGCNKNNEAQIETISDSTGITQSTIKADMKRSTQHLNVPYAFESRKQTLDIFLPEEGEGPFPVIIAIHGGGFFTGSKDSDDIAVMLKGIEYGYAVVAVDYRLSNEATFPAAVNDVKAAVRFIVKNAEKYSLNSDKIATWGDSAGGNLASIVGTTSGTDDLYDVTLGYENVSDKITAVVDWFGPINFLEMDQQFVESGITQQFPLVNSHTSAESRYIGTLIADAPELVSAASPSTYISADDPAFFIQHGTIDGIVPVQQSIDFANDLLQVLETSRVELILLEGANHGGEQFESEENLQLVFDFLDKHMKDD